MKQYRFVISIIFICLQFTFLLFTFTLQGESCPPLKSKLIKLSAFSWRFPVDAYYGYYCGFSSSSIPFLSFFISIVFYVDGYVVCILHCDKNLFNVQSIDVICPSPQHSSLFSCTEHLVSTLFPFALAERTDECGIVV